MNRKTMFTKQVCHVFQNDLFLLFFFFIKNEIDLYLFTSHLFRTHFFCCESFHSNLNLNVKIIVLRNSGRFNLVL
jgi:hypothetical protein